MPSFASSLADCSHAKSVIDEQRRLLQVDFAHLVAGLRMVQFLFCLCSAVADLCS